ncbi:bifunctional riboflavin kinase/FAD synthetase [Brevibacterium litoralis]|uniref:bifunctional riboflavin kinase/FAD synthetase n=1 Tax=Brevibacterium litoralis TaxID=3138935 RepID=UPI0032ED9FFE
MDVFRDVGAIPADLGPTAVTLGNFDGVHLGHRAVLGTLARAARARGLRSLAITFDPHPLQVHRPGDAPATISGPVVKTSRMAATGIDAVLVQHYTLDFAAQTPREFVVDFLIGRLGARYVAVGADVRFGTDNSGDLHTLQELAAEHDLEVDVIDEVGEGHRWSSTEIRGLVAAGEVARAAQLLGEPHTLVGEVVHGDARGREMGFPTANLSPAGEGMVPADGVYAGWVSFTGTAGRFPAAVSVGTNPTFDGHERRVEAHAIGVDFAGFDVYGSTMTLQFVARIRGQVTFTGMEALVERMHQDVTEVMEVLEA